VQEQIGSSNPYEQDYDQGDDKWTLHFRPCGVFSNAISFGTKS
jgi:hypothetical protein